MSNPDAKPAGIDPLAWPKEETLHVQAVAAVPRRLAYPGFAPVLDCRCANVLQQNADGDDQAMCACVLTLVSRTLMSGRPAGVPPAVNLGRETKLRDRLEYRVTTNF